MRSLFGPRTPKKPPLDGSPSSIACAVHADRSIRAGSMTIFRTPRLAGRLGHSLASSNSPPTCERSTCSATPCDGGTPCALQPWTCSIDSSPECLEKDAKAMLDNKEPGARRAKPGGFPKPGWLSPIPNHPWDWHMTYEVVSGMNRGIYAIHGVNGPCRGSPSAARPWRVVPSARSTWPLLPCSVGRSPRLSLGKRMARWHQDPQSGWLMDTPNHS